MIRAPVEFREKLQAEGTALGLPSVLDTVGYIFGRYFGGKQSPKRETAGAKPETTSETVAENAVTPQVAPPETKQEQKEETDVQPVGSKVTPVLYGGRIRVT